MKKSCLLLFLALCLFLFLFVKDLNISSPVVFAADYMHTLNNETEEDILLNNAIEESEIHCEFYNETQCKESEKIGKTDGCLETKSCGPYTPQKRFNCYALWTKDFTGKVSITLKGCFLNADICFDRLECVAKAKSTEGYLFCCCEGNLCNKYFDYKTTTEAPNPQFKAIIPEEVTYTMFLSLILVCTAIGAGFGAIISFILYGFKKYAQLFIQSQEDVPTATELTVCPQTSINVDVNLIHLNEIKARGRYGIVWKAQFKNMNVAVKVFSEEHKESWLKEQEIYKSINIDHSNILKFIGAQKNNSKEEYWLITAYHEHGSLYDYLNNNTLSWEEVSLIAETMTRGLAYLHEHNPNTTPVKPIIAHRDFKSKNILLKNDMTACIADFGLAIPFDSEEHCNGDHVQAGTIRYMAPEVLEGAITFSINSYLRIDMYAYGLVLWELISRCTISYGPVLEYKLPYEEEVGQMPSLEAMQSCVLERKCRPVIQEIWKNHAGLKTLCYTMEECWDYDGEARLTAACVLERIVALRRLVKYTQYVKPTLLTATTSL